VDLTLIVIRKNVRDDDAAGKNCSLVSGCKCYRRCFKVKIDSGSRPCQLVQNDFGWLSGLLSAMRRTGAIAGRAVMRLVVTAAGSVTLIAPHLNGAAVGVACAAFLAETLIPLFARET
jgi:hypothetical protein